MIGLGTLINFVAIIIGAIIGTLLGDRLKKNTRNLVTDALGLVTMLIAGLSVFDVTKKELTLAVGSGIGVLIILGSLILGGLLGSYFKLEEKFETVEIGRAHV